MFATLPYYSYENMNIVDWMHNCAGLYKWIMKIIVGPSGDMKSSANQNRQKADTQARRQLKANNIFPDLWEDAEQYLSPRKTAMIRDMDPDVIMHASTVWCKRWWKECGRKVPQGTRVATLREQILAWRTHLVANPEAKLVISTGDHHVHTTHGTHRAHDHIYHVHTRFQTITMATDTRASTSRGQTSVQHCVPARGQRMFQR